MEAKGNKDVTSTEMGGEKPILPGAKLPRPDEDPIKDAPGELRKAWIDYMVHGFKTNAEIFASYATPIGKFFDRAGIIVWGIVPTGFETFAQEEIPSLIQRLESVWEILRSKGIDREQLVTQSMLSPSTCCLVNPDKERKVEKAFAAVNQMAEMLRNKYL